MRKCRQGARQSFAFDDLEPLLESDALLPTVPRWRHNGVNACLFRRRHRDRLRPSRSFSRRRKTLTRTHIVAAR